MSAPTPPPSSAALAHFVDAFEAALAAGPDADLGRYLPPAGHPLRTAVLGELIRIDMEHGWSQGRPKRLAEYRRVFPAAFAEPGPRSELAFEEYRLRRLAGEDVSADEYRQVYGVDTAEWPAVYAEPAIGVLTEVSPRTLAVHVVPTPPAEVMAAFASAAVMPGPPRSGGPSLPESLPNSIPPAPAFPDPGTEFLGFRLEAELGRGAFGRVYLARQGDLGDRHVALKVAADIFDESQTLAQLQHTNIVPIYSLHRSGRLQAVCMPYFGCTTLADVLKHVHERPTLPDSGRELRSTVNGLRASTVASAGSVRKASTTAQGAPAAADVASPVVGSAAADGWAKLDGMSYIEAVLWLASQLADGLAHAHDRGVVHRDLKPANVLLTDEGRPMLLDFNLADDARRKESALRAAIGGTLPYMAPEQMEAFRKSAGRPDARADLYSLGVILYELLTGSHPFPLRKGAVRDTVPAMIADRHGPLPSVRNFNPAVSPAAEAIVRKCLAANPADRYQRAEQLRDDLDRQLGHRALKHAPNPSVRERVRKWARRHPRLTSSGTVVVVAAVLLAGTGGAAAFVRERSRDLEARAAFADHRAAFADAQVFLDDRNRSLPRLDEGMDRLRGVLARYGVPADGVADDAVADSRLARHLPPEDRDRLRADVGEAFYLMAHVAAIKARTAADPAAKAEQLAVAERWNTAAERYAGDRLARAVREQRADLAALGGNAAGSEQIRKEAKDTAVTSSRDEYLIGVLFARQGRYRDALPHLRRATLLDPEHFSAWFVRGTVHLSLEQNELAAMCFGSCAALRKDYAPAWLNRGLAYSRLRFFDQACDDYDRALRLDPGLADVYVQRAGARAAQEDLKEAEADYGRALETGKATARVYFLRAAVRDRLGDKAGAAADRADGFRTPVHDEWSWLARAETRLADDAPGALADVEEALKLNPEFMFGLQLKAHVLAERVGRPADALAVLDRAVALFPEYVPARAGRGVLLARVGKRDAAIQDAKDALLRDTKAPNLYQVACIYALTSQTHPDDKREAFKLLWSALTAGFGRDIVDTDSDLDPLRKDPEFSRLVQSAKVARVNTK